MKDSKHISKVSGFKIPDNYFQNFKVTDFKIENTKMESGYKVPDNYFEDFEVKLPKKSKVIKLSDLQKSIAIAAVLFVILGTLIVGLIINPQPEPQELNFSKINKTEIENYLEDEMLMDQDLYMDEDNINLDFKTKNIKENNIIDDMDDISIEQLMDY